MFGFDLWVDTNDNIHLDTCGEQITSMLHITSLLQITDTRYWHTCGKHHYAHDCGKKLQTSLTCVSNTFHISYVMLGLNGFRSCICLLLKKEYHVGKKSSRTHTQLSATSVTAACWTCQHVMLSGRICLWILSFSITHTLWSAECCTGWMDMGVGLPRIALDVQFICIILTNSQNPLINELSELDYLAFCFDFFFHFYMLV